MKSLGTQEIYSATRSPIVIANNKQKNARPPHQILGKKPGERGRELITSVKQTPFPASLAPTAARN